VELWDDTGRWYVAGNVVAGFPAITIDNWADGMPDEWERAQGLDPADPADRNGIIINPPDDQIRFLVHDCSIKNSLHYCIFL